MTTNNLEKLDVWRKAKEYALMVYREIIPCLPPEEKWAMTSQIRRSVLSIPANLAEGHGRFYFQETIRFCYIARGSLEETQTFVAMACELGYITPSLYQTVSTAGENLARLINGYIIYLKKVRLGADEPGFPSVHEPLAGYLLDPQPDTPTGDP